MADMNIADAFDRTSAYLDGWALAVWNPLKAAAHPVLAPVVAAVTVLVRPVAAPYVRMYQRRQARQYAGLAALARDAGVPRAGDLAEIAADYRLRASR